MAEQGEEFATTGAELASLMPEVKPSILAFYLDHEDRLWVRPGSDPEAPARFDVFEPDGTYLKSVVLEEAAPHYRSPSIRDGHVYAISTDSLGAPMVFRTAALDL